MKKRLVTICILLVIGGVGGWFYFSRTTKIPQESQRASLSENLPSQNLKEYQGEAGFSFNYPEELTITNKETSDSTTYVDLVITSPKVPGQITFKISDTKLKSLKDWSGGKELTLAGIPAWEINKDGGLSTTALDQGVLFEIEVLPDKEEAFWLSVYQTLISTFSFSSPEVGESVNEVIFEGEEIIE